MPAVTSKEKKQPGPGATLKGMAALNPDPLNKGLAARGARDLG